MEEDGSLIDKRMLHDRVQQGKVIMTGCYLDEMLE